MRELYAQLGSAERVAEIVGCSNTTVVKYVRDLFPVRASDDEVVRVFRLTGNLRRAGGLLQLSATTVWRRLQRAGVEVGTGARDSRRLYKTLRRRVSRSAWRQQVLARDQACCRECGAPSTTVHHVKRLSVIRDEIARETGINPFQSYQDLRAFTDAVMAAHRPEDGVVLCTTCHDTGHRANRL